MSIIQKLRMKDSTFDEIATHLDRQSGLLGEDMQVSKRTFQRDISDIREVFNIEISCNSENKYFISDQGDESLKRRMLETLDQLELLYKTKYNSKYVYFESRKTAGTENMHGILHGIHNNLLISFRHEKYWEDDVTYRTVEPYALKESQNRWYLIAKDRKDSRIKIFALDRISELKFESTKFSYPKDLDIVEMFRYSFGIMSESKPVQDIVLSFESDQRKYLGTLQLHPSQTVIKEDKNEYRIRLRMRITFDFIKEILSYGEAVEVISPSSLRKTIREHHKEAYKMNK